MWLHWWHMQTRTGVSVFGKFYLYISMNNVWYARYARRDHWSHRIFVPGNGFQWSCRRQHKIPWTHYYYMYSWSEVKEGIEVCMLGSVNFVRNFWIFALMTTLQKKTRIFKIWVEREKVSSKNVWLWGHDQILMTLFRLQHTYDAIYTQYIFLKWSFSLV